jgi:hypothetical protein
MRGLTLLSFVLSSCLALPVAASMPIRSPAPGELRPWSEVEAIARLVDDSSAYESGSGRWILASDGRLAVMTPASAEYDSPAAATIGRYRVDGAWLLVEIDGMAIDPSSMSAETRAQYDAWREQSEAIVNATDGEDAEVVVEAFQMREPAVTEGRDDADDDRTQRLLRVPVGDGEVLVEATALIDIAAAWNGAGPLEVPIHRTAAWRMPGWVRDPDDYGFSFRIEDPLHAGLPIELARLLRPNPIEARAVEVLETLETLEWRRQQSSVRLRLDRGERDGLYPQMPVRGLPPNDEYRGEIIEVHPDHALARFELTRFSPREQPAMPGPGMRFTTRALSPGACALDFSAAVRGEVTALLLPTQGPSWDGEGYAWFELMLDQGAAQGLVVGDALHGEDYGIDGEGRVLSVESGSSKVLWRVIRYDESHVPAWPRAGAALVTPAWRRAAWETFGGATTQASPVGHD